MRQAVEGKLDCSPSDRLKAAMYILDRVEAKPVADGTGGMFQGAKIVVNTGFQDAPTPLVAPTIDMPVNGHDKPSDIQSGDQED